MNSLRSGTLLLVVILLASEKSVGVAAAADGFDNMTVLAIVNGPSEIDLDGDGRKDLVFSARRKNFNAHAYSHITFYRATGGTNPRWELIPFFDRKDVPTVDWLGDFAAERTQRVLAGHLTAMGGQIQGAR